MTRETASVTVTLELDAGNASLVILGKMLGPTGVAPFEVKRRYDAATTDRRGEIIPAVITIEPANAGRCGSKPHQRHP
ncbi:hypothetical protein ACFYO7_22700 [Nocardia salmonicida]|uniref:hypothetical protein n=1 Tax=Nocardia salmonicida TaxID=53431 RepID=UPI0036BB7381